MPLSPMDDTLAHQTPETFDHVYTGDRNFYDRYYGMHENACSGVYHPYGFETPDAVAP